MKKSIACLLALFCLCMPFACQGEAKAAGNYTDEMKIPYTTDLSEADGADSVERQGDHENSPYFSTLDFYNMESTDSLTILHHFQTQQQTSEWSCGVSSALMVMNWYGKLGDYNEETLAAYRSNALAPEATSLRQRIEIFEGVGGYTLYSTYDCQDTVYDVFTMILSRKPLRRETRFSWDGTIGAAIGRSSSVMTRWAPRRPRTTC